jgi:pimeloyl-ACP methyl ester carboxylesterase
MNNRLDEEYWGYLIMKQKVVYWVRLLSFGLVVVYVMAISGYAWISAKAAISPSQHEICCGSPLDFFAEYESVSISTADGPELSGWYIPSQNGAAVVLLHGYGGDRTSTLALAEMLYSNGYGVLMYDQRASGESEGDVKTWGWRDVDDLEAVIGFLHSRSDVQFDSIGVWGCSTGAEIAIGAGARFEDIQAVIADGAFYTTAVDAWPPYEVTDWIGWPIYPLFIEFMEWRSGTSAAMSLKEAVTRISPRSLMLIAAGEDGYEQYRINQYYERANEPKDYWVVEGAGHCGGPVTQRYDYEIRIVDFFDAALLNP